MVSLSNQGYLKDLLCLTPWSNSDEHDFVRIDHNFYFAATPVVSLRRRSYTCIRVFLVHVLCFVFQYARFSTRSFRLTLHLRSIINFQLRVLASFFLLLSFSPVFTCSFARSVANSYTVFEPMEVCMAVLSLSSNWLLNILCIATCECADVPVWFCSVFCLVLCRCTGNSDVQERQVVRLATAWVDTRSLVMMHRINFHILQLCFRSNKFQGTSWVFFCKQSRLAKNRLFWHIFTTQHKAIRHLRMISLKQPKYWGENSLTW